MATEISATIYGLWNNNCTGSSNVTPPRAGMFFRSNGYVYETLCEFDLTAYSGTVLSAQIKFTVSDRGTGTVAQIVYAMEQNKTNPTSWSSPPIYNDFGNFPGTHTYWDTELSNVSNVVSDGEYTINDTGDNIKDLVQSWINDSDNNWGFVLTRNDNATTRWVEISAVKLVLVFLETFALDYGMRFQSGANEYLASISSFTPPANGSVSFWMYSNDLSGIHEIIGCHSAWEIRTDGITLYNGLNEGSTPLGSSATLQVETRYHIVCTYDSSNNAQIYINGSLDNSGSGNDGSPSSNNISIGVRTGSSNYYDGYVEDVRIYDRVLSAGEVETIYAVNGIDEIVYSLLHRWLLDEKAPNSEASGVGSIKDNGQNQLNMTPNNSPLYGSRRIKRRRFV
jgi:hypothetical protein